MSKNVVICGAGVGGLVCGALLTKYGHRVTLVDGQYKVGGYASCFRRNKTVHEVAVHFIPGFDKETNLYKELQSIGMFEEIEFVRSPEFYTYESLLGEKLSIPDDLEKANSYLIMKFPNEKKALNLFFEIHRKVTTYGFNFYDSELRHTNDELKQIHEKFGHYFLKDFLDEYFESDHLKFVLSASFQYYHDNFETMNFLRYVFLSSTFYKNGQFFIKGGSERYSEFLKDYILNNGGQVLLGSFVTGLKRTGSEINHLNIIKRSNKEITKLSGDLYIFNNSPLEVERWISDKKLLNTNTKSFLPMKCSSSACSLYFEFSKDPSSFGVTGYMNYLFFGENKKLGGTFGIGFIDISKIDHGLGNTERFLCTVTFLDDYKSWFLLSPDEYLERKKEVTEEVLRILDESYPGIAESCLSSELGTPLTMEKFTNNPEGSIYGFSQEAQDFFKEELIHNEMKNTYFCSAWTSKSGIGLYPVSIDATRILKKIKL